MSKHTQGPWKIDWYICREDGKELWRVPRSIGPASTDHCHWAGRYITVDEADANLIAAAPDLLEALKSTRAFVNSVAPHGGLFERINAAIARAEGKV
jgi:hypothetical protein